MFININLNIQTRNQTNIYDRSDQLLPKLQNVFIVDFLHNFGILNLRDRGSLIFMIRLIPHSFILCSLFFYVSVLIGSCVFIGCGVPSSLRLGLVDAEFEIFEDIGSLLRQRGQ